MISFVGSITEIAANGNNAVLNLTSLLDETGSVATLQEGDVVIVAYATGEQGTDDAMSTSSTGWTELAELYHAGNVRAANVAVYWKVMGSTPDTSMTVVGSAAASSGTAAAAFAFRGVDTTTPIETHTTATGNPTMRPDPPSITPTASGAWVVVIGGGSAQLGLAFTNPGDLSSTTNHFRSTNAPDLDDATIGIGLKTDWSSGAFNPAQWTSGDGGTGSAWAAVSISLTPASGGSGTSLTVSSASASYATTALTINAGTLVGTSPAALTNLSGTLNVGSGTLIPAAAAALSHATQAVAIIAQHHIAVVGGLLSVAGRAVFVAIGGVLPKRLRSRFGIGLDLTL